MKDISRLLRLDLPMLPVLISTFAILLSQFPPIHSWFSKPKIDVELGTNAMILDNWGAMVFQPYLLLHNSGDEHGIVKSVTIDIRKEHGVDQIGVLPVQTYYEKVQVVTQNTQAPQVPVRLIRIPPGEVWANYVSAWKPASENRQDKINQLISNTEEDFRKNYKEGQVWIMPDNLHNEALDLSLDEQNKILSGKYYIKVSALDKDEEVLDENFYTFSLRKSQIQAFTDKLKEYKHGGGVIFPLRANKFFGTWVDIHPTYNSKEIRSLF